MNGFFSIGFCAPRAKTCTVTSTLFTYLNYNSYMIYNKSKKKKIIVCYKYCAGL